MALAAITSTGQRMSQFVANFRQPEDQSKAEPVSPREKFLHGRKSGPELFELSQDQSQRREHEQARGDEGQWAEQAAGPRFDGSEQALWVEPAKADRQRIGELLKKLLAMFFATSLIKLRALTAALTEYQTAAVKLAKQLLEFLRVDALWSKAFLEASDEFLN